MKFFQFTIRDLLWLLIVIALVLAWRIDRSRVPQWEYSFRIVPGGSDAADFWNKLGTEGWEICGYDFRGHQESAWLKRPKK